MYRIGLIQDQAVTPPSFEGIMLDAVAGIEGFQPEDGARQVYKNADDLLAAGSPLDTVWVQTRTGYHAEYVIKALQAGYDVICNAPLCITGAAAWQILETAKYTGRRLSVLNPPSQFWNELRIALGEVQRFHAWARTSAVAPGNHYPDGGLLYTIFFGLADALSKLLVSVDRIEGQVEETGAATEIERAGQAEFVLVNGGAGFLDWSTGAEDADPAFSIKLEGTHGTVQINGRIEEGRLEIEKIETENIESNKSSFNGRADIEWGLLASGAALPQWDAFTALRTVEFIDRIYSRIRSTSRP